MTSRNSFGARTRSAASRGAGNRLLFLLVALLLGAAAIVGASGPEQALAQVDAPAVTGSPTPTSSLASTTGPLTITKTPSTSSVASGGSLTWTMVVTNTGGAALSNVALTDQVNGMTSLVLTASPGSCSQSAGNVTCKMPSGKSLGGGATWTVTIQGTVTAAAGTTLNNSATATGTKSSTTYTASASASVQVTGSTGGSLPDLTVSINAPTSVVTSGALTYTLTVNNIGAANATGVEVDDTVPAGVTNVSPSGTSLFTCSTSSLPTIKCTGGAINAGGSGTITINTSAPSSTGSITDAAQVDPTCSSSTESNCSNNSATFATTVTNPPPPAAPDLTVTITAPTNVTLCNTTGCTTSIAYTLTVTNAGNAAAAASMLEVDDTLPAAITSATGSGSGGYGCTVTLPTVKCTTATALAAGASDTIKINGTMPYGTPTGTATDTAAVNPTCSTTVPPVESNCSNNNASATTTLSNATTTGTLTLQATAATTADPKNGTIVAQPVDGKITYTLVILNTSSARADSVVLTDGTQGLDASRITATPDAASAAAGVTCVVNAPKVTCSAGGPTWRIAAGGTATVTIVGYTVTQAGTQISSTGTPLIDTATVTGNISNVGQTNTASVSTTTVPSTNLNITQTSSSSSSSTPNSAHSAADLVYTIAVGNSGFYNANPVEVRVPLPAGVLRQKPFAAPPTALGSNEYSTNGGFICSIDSSNVVDCTGGTVPGFGPSTTPAANTVTITLNLVAPETTGSISDTATVNPHNTIPESDYTDNSFALTTTVTTGVDLCVPPGGGTAAGCPAASVTSYCPYLSPGPLDCSTTKNGVATASRLTYVIKVPNQGTQDTTGVVVQDTLPTGVTFISAKGDHNLTCSYASPTVTCTGGIINGTYSTDATTQWPTYTSNFPPSPANTDVATITIVVFSLPTPGAMSNQVSVDPANAISEFDKTNNVNSLTTPAAYGGANPYIDLSIAKVQKSPTATPNQVAQNGLLTYELTISNDTTANPSGTNPPGSLSRAEEQTATNVAVKDFVPAGARFISVTAAPLTGGSGGFQCSETPLLGQQFAGELDCSGGTVAAGGSTTIDVTMFAPPANPTATPYTTQALVDPNGAIAEGDETNNSAQITTTSKDEAGPADNAYIDLALTMTADHGVGMASPPGVIPGGAVVYTLTVTNNGSNDATNVEVKDTLPGGSTTFVSASDASPTTPGAFSCSQAVSGTVDCTGGTVTGGGATRTILITINAPNSSGDFPQGAGPNKNDITITNQAIVNPSGTIPESTLSNNTAQVTVTVHSNVNLKMDPISGPSSATQSSNQTYVLTVKNEGSDPVTCGHPNCVEVIDPLPVGMIIENSINYTPANAWQCQAQQNPVNVVDCVGDLGANSNVTINIPVFITATDGSTLNNQACVDPKNVIVEYDETDNCSTKSTTIGHVDMTINKTAGTGTVTPGQTESYTLVVTNSGTADATAGDVMVTDDLSSIGLTVAGSPSPSNGFDCSATTSTMVSCTNSAASLAAGSSATITFNATVPTSATGQIVNTASVTASDDTGTANKSAQATVNVGAPTVDLAIQSVTGTPATVSAGQALTYTIQAANLGTGAATSSPVVVHNSLNSVSGLTLVSAVGTNGFTCGALSGTSVDCSSSLGLGAAGTSGSPGATTMITIRFMVDPAAVNPIVLTSTIDPNHGYTQDTNTTNNTAQATTSVSSSAVCSPSPCKDLSTTILGSPNPVASGGTVTYSVTVGNVGSVDLIGKDNTHPAVLEYINLDPTVSSVTVTSVTGGAGLTNPWACDPYPVNPPFGPGSPGTPTTLVCHGDLTQGQGAVINLTATFGAGSGSTITTTVIADPNLNIERPLDALDTDTSAITVQ